MTCGGPCPYDANRANAQEPFPDDDDLLDLLTDPHHPSLLWNSPPFSEEFDFFPSLELAGMLSPLHDGTADYLCREDKEVGHWMIRPPFTSKEEWLPSRQR